ncbi:uncharacterized protein J4E87_004865 [Alternaria ethzedia]|uniref:uncharacterized protein n=1 Tax=Alternaria ethzedia TaxID=181014 RepID=UPI0020C29411|nr:uncharacterized protein J4E87_004865 [Alternaria ethzedia]KAI4626363.1 hypothetical protein J4E87_004865 [Alternaria ethzedia]
MPSILAPFASMGDLAPPKKWRWQAYADTPLNRLKGSQEFRLLELQASELSGPIKCALRTYSFDSAPPAYTALSYTWGSADNCNAIELNGVPFTVGYNLWSYLDEMRSQEQYQLYWIDAVCINQRNVLERNHQVQNMRQIYSNAASVSIWLGRLDQSPHCGVGMEFLATGEKAELCTYDQGKGILGLCSRNYWTRVWIIQEIMLAKECTIYYCNLRANLSTLYNLIGEVRDFYTLEHPEGKPQVRLPRLLLETPAATIVLTKFMDRFRLGVRKTVPLMRLLEIYRHQMATNILDKVYALHGLTPDSEAMEVEYEISPAQLAVKLLCYVCLKFDTRGIDFVERRKQLMRFGEMVAQILDVAWSPDDIRMAITVIDD